MKTKSLNIIGFIILLFSLGNMVGCDRDESFVYTGSEKINFTQDSIYFSFGGEPFSIMDTTMQIKVEIVGKPFDKDRTYNIHLNEERTTAQAGVHYDALKDTYTLPSGMLASYIPVRIHRLNLDDEKVYTLNLELNANEDFELGVVEYRSLVIAFTNRLDCPIWWNELSHWLGEYDVRKYQKFIEINGGPVNQHDININKYGILRVFKKVKEYFEEHPEFGVEFPDVDWIV